MLLKYSSRGVNLVDQMFVILQKFNITNHRVRCTPFHISIAYITQQQIKFNVQNYLTPSISQQSDGTMRSAVYVSKQIVFISMALYWLCVQASIAQLPMEVIEYTHRLKTFEPCVKYCCLTFIIRVTSCNGNFFFRVTGLLCGEFTGQRWIPPTKASDVALWCFLWSAPQATAGQTVETSVIGDAIAPVMMSLEWVFPSITGTGYWWWCKVWCTTDTSLKQYIMTGFAPLVCYCDSVNFSTVIILFWIIFNFKL